VRHSDTNRSPTGASYSSSQPPNYGRPSIPKTQYQYVDDDLIDTGLPPSGPMSICGLSQVDVISRITPEMQRLPLDQRADPLVFLYKMTGEKKKYYVKYHRVDSGPRPRSDLPDMHTGDFSTKGVPWYAYMVKA
jgi:hypothetical protein